MLLVMNYEKLVGGHIISWSVHSGAKGTISIHQLLALSTMTSPSHGSGVAFPAEAWWARCRGTEVGAMDLPVAWEAPPMLGSLSCAWELLKRRGGAVGLRGEYSHPGHQVPWNWCRQWQRSLGCRQSAVDSSCRSLQRSIFQGRVERVSILESLSDALFVGRIFVSCDWRSSGASLGCEEKVAVDGDSQWNRWDRVSAISSLSRHRELWGFCGSFHLGKPQVGASTHTCATGRKSPTRTLVCSFLGPKLRSSLADKTKLQLRTRHCATRGVFDQAENRKGCVWWRFQRCSEQ